MDKFNCDSELCIYREIKTIPEFDTLNDIECIVDITIDKDGNIDYDSDSLLYMTPIIKELTSFINDLIEKEFIPLNCSVGLWYLCEGGYSLNIIGFYDGDDFDDDPTINYFIDLV